MATRKAKDLGLTPKQPGTTKAPKKTEDTQWPAQKGLNIPMGSVLPPTITKAKRSYTKKKEEVAAIDPTTVPRQPFQNKGKNPKRFDDKKLKKWS